MNDLIRESSKDAEMFIFAYQEIWNACNVVAEAASSVIDNFRKKLKKKVLKHTRVIISKAYPARGNKITCSGKQHHSLMTVACRFFDGDSKPRKSWFKSAFTYGWTENGKSTNTFLFGFKGLLGTSIAFQGDKQLLVINLHLSSKSLEDRRKGIVVARELAKPYLDSGLFSVILVGDFNARSFSLVVPDTRHEKLVDYSNNVGGAFLMMCLTDAIKKEDFAANEEKDFDCSKVIAKAKEYDEISYIFKREFPQAIEAKDLDFAPTFCFNFHKFKDKKNRPWLAPKKSEAIPSFTDRMFYVSQKGLSLSWSEYTSLPSPAIEPSDHRAIIGVFSLSAAKFDQKTFFDAATFDQKDPKSETLPKAPYRNFETEKWVFKPPAGAKPKGFAIPDYQPFKAIDHNKMLEGVSVPMLFDFLEFVGEIYGRIEAGAVKKRIVV